MVQLGIQAALVVWALVGIVFAALAPASAYSIEGKWPKPAWIGICAGSALLFAIWPFTRLVHVFSAPIGYLTRPYIVYRSRVPTPPPEPGTSGRRWRKIGGPY